MGAQIRPTHESLRVWKRRLPSASRPLLYLLCAASIILFYPDAFAIREEASSALTGEARMAFQRGALEDAENAWRQVIDAARHNKDQPALIDALTEIASVYHAAGKFRLAESALDEARDLADKIHDRGRLGAVLNTRGAVRTFSHKAEFAQDDLMKALDLTRREKDRATEASVENNLGILFAAREQYPEAEKAYGLAVSLTTDPVLTAKASGNQAETAVLAGDFAHARALNAGAVSAVGKLPDSHDKIFCLMHSGKTWEKLFERSPDHEQTLRLKALRIYEEAAKMGEALGDSRALSYALGYAGHLYEQEKKFEAAQRLTRRAAFLAQQSQSPDILFQWEWQAARLDAAEGQRPEAIAEYKHAIQTLDTIRDDLSNRVGNSNAHSSFREAVGSIFFELANLLLEKVNDLHDDKAIQACLKEARDACETLKAVELEDYFQDDCVSLLKAKTKAVENISPSAAIIYLIPLHDRTEVITSIDGRLERVKSPVGAEELTAAVRAFRLHLEKQTTNEYLEEARQLYSWLIHPLEPLLQAHKIDTLVFVPDGALRTIPMAALNDGRRFLIEKYAIAVTPGLTLMEPKPIKRTNVGLLSNALSEGVVREGQQFPPLPYVKEEIDHLQRLYGGTSLMNKDFRVPQVEKVFAAQQYSVVHFASHGEFSSDSHKTFLLTYDGTLTLDGLEHLIRPSQLREHPVEMLSLSACQTAAGDDRAALGLAGVAVKAGARSAFATLWYVDDQASTTLVSDFYDALYHEPDISKAKALQKAQVKLLSQPATGHPCLWAPYLIIGNWL